MPSTFEQLSPTRAKLIIDMPFADLEPAIDASYKEIASQVNIPGFRKGKVPARLIDQRFGRGAVLQEAINSVLPQAYGAAVQEHDLRPLGQPDIDISELNDGTNVVFTAEVDVRPDFELPELSGISIEVPVALVTDEEVEVDHGAPFVLPEGAHIVEVKDAGNNTFVDDRLWNTNGGGDGGQ